MVISRKKMNRIMDQAVENGGNAARAGLKAGDQVIYTSSFFGDELWPADKLGFTKTAIQAKPDSVYFVVSRYQSIPIYILTHQNSSPSLIALTILFLANELSLCRGAPVDVKRLPKRPAPPAFGRKLTDAQKASPTHSSIPTHA